MPHSKGDLDRLIATLRDRTDAVAEVTAVAKIASAYGGNQGAAASALALSRTYVNQCVRAAALIERLGPAKFFMPLSKSMLFELATADDAETMLQGILAGKIKTVHEARGNRATRHRRVKNVASRVKMTADSATGSFLLTIAFCPSTATDDQRAEMIETLKEALSMLNLIP